MIIIFYIELIAASFQLSKDLDYLIPLYKYDNERGLFEQGRTTSGRLLSNAPCVSLSRSQSVISSNTVF